MDKCTKERIRINSLRTGITLATGALVWFASAWLAQHFGSSLTVEAQAGLSLVAVIGMWFGTKPMFSFTEECMLMQQATSSRSKASDNKKVYLPQARVAAATAKGIRADRAPKPDKSAKAAVTTPAVTLSAGKLFAQGRITIEVTRPEGAAPQVTVTTSGLSASEFKGNNGNGGFRQKLESIPGIKWENPKNLGEGKRTMAGAVKSQDEGAVAAKLTEVASRYSR